MSNLKEQWKDELVLLKDPQIQFRLSAVIKKAEDTYMEGDTEYMRGLHTTLILYRTHRFKECFDALGELFAYVNHMDAKKLKESWSLVIELKNRRIYFVQSLITGEVVNIFSRT